MKTFITGVFLILHGLIHLLYFGQSWRLFELRAQMVWPDGSWAFSKLLGDGSSRLLASVSLVVAAAGFLAGGIGIFFQQAWWRPMIVGAALWSIALFVLFWDGKLQNLADKGSVGILISVIILLAVLVFKWPL